MSILVVGSVAFDDVTSPSGTVKNILGGAATYFSLAASYFTKVRIVGVVGDDFGPEQEKVFHQHGIDIRGLERAEGKTFRWGDLTSTISTKPKLTTPTLTFSRPSNPASRRNMRIQISCSSPIFSPLCRPMSAGI